MRRIQRHMQEEEARVLHGDLNGDPIACGSSTLSEDSEAEFAVFQPKALPKLAVGFKTGKFTAKGRKWFENENFHNRFQSFISLAGSP